MHYSVIYYATALKHAPIDSPSQALYPYVLRTPNFLRAATAAERTSILASSGDHVSKDYKGEPPLALTQDKNNFKFLCNAVYLIPNKC